MVVVTCEEGVLKGVRIGSRRWLFDQALVRDLGQGKMSVSFCSENLVFLLLSLSSVHLPHTRGWLSSSTKFCRNEFHVRRNDSMIARPDVDYATGVGASRT